MLIVTRHGESIANAENWFAGIIDAALTDKGRDQARILGGVLGEKAYRFDHVFASDLSRAYDTAEIALEHSKLNDHLKIDDIWNVERLPILRERNAGRFGGIKKHEAEAEFGEDAIRQWFRQYSERPPEGESIEDVVNRVREFLRDSAKPLIEQDKTVFVACHGIVTMGFLVALGLETPVTIVERRIENTELFVFEKETVLKAAC